MKFPRPGLEVNKLQGLDPAPKDPLPIQKDGMGREVGGGIQDGEPMDTQGWFMSMYGKNHYNIGT